MRTLILLVLITLTSCTLSTSKFFKQEPTSIKPIRYLALGDSYTIGEGVEDEDRFPQLIASRLREEGVEVQLEIVARTGWTTDELLQGIESSELTPPYDFVTLLIGVNNQYRGGGMEEYRLEFENLLEKAVFLAGGNASKVIVLSIPDWGVTPFAQDWRKSPSQIAREIDEFNEVSWEVAEKAGVHYVDITPISREAETDRTLLAKDGLHPSGKMYSEWTELIMPLVRLALKLET